MICTVANALWFAGCMPEANRFRLAMRSVRDAQLEVLRDILHANRQSEFGRRHGFSTISTPREYQLRLPLRSYEDFEVDIARMAAGTKGVLTCEAVRLFEPTSGSTSATKLVPYTRSLRRQFQRGISPWIADLFMRHPDLMRGQAYWSVSPAMTPSRRTAGGVPIGFDDDSAYVGGWRRKLVQAVMAAHPSLREAPDTRTFQYRTILALVRSGALRLISVWNPSFLTILLESMSEYADALVSDLRDCPRRAQIVRRALVASTPAERHSMLWPHLRLVSCWADGNAAGAARDLGALFPQAHVQAKGLIATEAFISLPLTGCDGSALALRSHFLEFAPINSQGNADESSPLLAHELERDRRYTVIVSTAGGLYRYRLNDVVEVIGRVRDCPLIRFIGKHEYVSDWFGEKLHEAHVASVLSAQLSVGPPFRLRQGSGGLAAASAEAVRLASTAFAMLACDNDLSPPAYVAYVERECDDAALMSAAAAIDDGLRQNFHYDYARLLGQLGPVRAFRVERGAETYLSAAVGNGQRAGGVKPLALDRRGGWSRRFRGRFIAMASRSTPSGSAPLRLVR